MSVFLKAKVDPNQDVATINKLSNKMPGGVDPSAVKEYPQDGALPRQWPRRQRVGAGAHHGAGQASG
jgi:hypothetical protein